MNTERTHTAIVFMIQKMQPGFFRSLGWSDARYCQELLGKLFDYKYDYGSFEETDYESMTVNFRNNIDNFAMMFEELLKLILEGAYITMTCKIFRSGLQYLLNIAMVDDLEERCPKLAGLITRFDEYLATHKPIPGSQFGQAFDVSRMSWTHVWWF